MKIGGLHKVSLIDYPEAICAVVFLQGCNFKCPYCHNPQLVEPKLFTPCLEEKKVLEFLATRIGKLDAVTVTGGEPTIQKDLLPFIMKIKKLGFAVKLDSNGTQPKIIKELLDAKLLDFIAMDIKAPLEKYKSIVKVTVDTQSIEESIKLILKSKIQLVFQTFKYRRIAMPPNFAEMIRSEQVPRLTARNLGLKISSSIKLQAGKKL